MKIKNVSKKRKFISVFLALILTFSINFAPISIAKDRLSQTRAFESTVLYPASSSKTTGSNLNTTEYLKEFENFFKDNFGTSSVDFNIMAYYNAKFDSLFKTYADAFFNNIENNVNNFADDENVGSYVNNEVHANLMTYEAQLNEIFAGKKISEFYSTNKTISSTYSTFQKFVEALVLNGLNFVSTNIKPLVKSDDGLAKSVFYNFFANKIPGVAYYKFEKEKEETSLSTGDDFYANSDSYKNFKDILDNKIKQDIAIKTYDEVQDDVVATIIANDVPTISYYGYEMNGSNFVYESETTPTISYVQEKISISQTNSLLFNKVYYFGTDLNTIDSANLDAVVQTGLTTTLREFIKETTPISVFEKNQDCLSFRLIKEGEFGYISEEYPTFYRYGRSENPYTPQVETYNSGYTLYVLNDNPSESELATYDSLNFKVLSSSELEADENLGYYISLPYFGEISNFSQKNKYFDVAFSSIFKTTEFKNKFFDKFVSLFTNQTLSSTKANISKVYLKLTDSTSNKYVYIGESQYDDFESDYLLTNEYNYSKYVKTFDDSNANMNDYKEMSSIDANYYYTTKNDNIADKYKLYAKKVQTKYASTSTTATYDGYELKKVSAKQYEKLDSSVEVALESYELSSGSKKIYFVCNETEIVDGCTRITETELSEHQSLYVPIPASVKDSLELPNTYNYYYKHESVNGSNINKIYVIDDKADATDVEVYKTLNYTVLTTNDYNQNYDNYDAVTESDKNYNANFKLYYKLDTAIEHSALYVQNELTNENAIFIVEQSSDTTTIKSTLRTLNYTCITSNEFTNNSSLYVKVLGSEAKESKYDGRQLYYKYKTVETSDKAIYIFSSTANSDYIPFYSTDKDYFASDYELIAPSDANYVVGKSLYYKKIRTATNAPVESNVDNYKLSYYSLSTSSGSISLAANSYYAISFYAYTNGTYENGNPIEASVKVVDGSKVIDDVEVTKISTNGNWVKYFLFISSNSLATSAVRLYFYMGNSESILGSNLQKDVNGKVVFASDTVNLPIKKVSGVVMFDEIKVTTINETSFNKRTIDEKDVTKTYEKDGETEITTSGDKFGNNIVVANDSTALSIIGNADNRARNNVSMANGKTWNEIFNFDSTTSPIDDLTFETKQESSQYLDYSSSWQYYISKNNIGQSNNETLSAYENAYLDVDSNVLIKVVDEPADKMKEDEEPAEQPTEEPATEPSTEPEKVETDIKYVDSTFNSSNKVLHIKNLTHNRVLGIASNSIIIPQHGYYKLTVWIYSPDKDAAASLYLTSILKTSGKIEVGNVISQGGSVKAHLEDYEKTTTGTDGKETTTSTANEYGWIPVYFYIEGNVYHNQNVSLALLADENCDVYFDNISIEKITSSAYSSAAGENKFSISLSPANSMYSKGITGGYFNSISVADAKAENSEPKAVNNDWAANSNNTSNVVAGIVETSNDYILTENNFYNKYYKDDGTQKYPFNKDENPRLQTNIFAIHINDTVVDEVTGNEVDITGNYKINTKNSTSLSTANKIYAISFKFYAGFDFKGDMIANLYQSSVASGNEIAKIRKTYAIADETWTTYTFYVKTNSNTASIYIEFGVENAVGTCFFSSFANDDKCSYTSIEEINRHYLQDDVEDESATIDIAEALLTKNIVAVDLVENMSTANLSQNDNNVYTTPNYETDLSTTRDYTVGKYGTVIADYYTKSSETTYTVTIDSVLYYIKDNKMYSDKYFTKEVTSIENKEVQIEEKQSTINVKVGNTDETVTKVSNNTYTYHFNKEYTINKNVVLTDLELTNDKSQTVLILSNDNKTDYISIAPSKTSTLSSGSFYAIRVYVKTSDFEAFTEDETGLNIMFTSSGDLKNVNFENINTTKLDDSSKEYNGFVCYQLMIKTGTSSISSLQIEFSLGTSKNTNKGYALISGVEIEKLNDANDYDLYKSSLTDNERERLTEKDYSSSATNTSDDSSKSQNSLSWSTFFYVFSSLLLGIVLIMALVAIIIKKHPIKKKVKVSNKSEEENIIITPKENNKKSKIKKQKSDDIELTEENSENDETKKSNKTTDDSQPEEPDEGFV